MKKTDIAKKFDYSKFNTSDVNSFTGLTGNQTVTVKASDLGHEKLASVMKQMEQDTRRGVGIYFKEGEEIYFPPFEKMVFELRGFEVYNGTLRINLAVSAYCERYKEFMFPLSIVRRVPLDEPVEIDNVEYTSGRDFLLEDNPLGSILIKNTLSDLDRCKILADSVVKVTARLRLTQAKFGEDADGKPQRTEGSKPLTCYRFAKA